MLDLSYLKVLVNLSLVGKRTLSIKSLALKISFYFHNGTTFTSVSIFDFLGKSGDISVVVIGSSVELVGQFRKF